MFVIRKVSRECSLGFIRLSGVCGISRRRPPWYFDGVADRNVFLEIDVLPCQALTAV